MNDNEVKSDVDNDERIMVKIQRAKQLIKIQEEKFFITRSEVTIRNINDLNYFIRVLKMCMEYSHDKRYQALCSFHLKQDSIVKTIKKSYYRETTSNECKEMIVLISDIIEFFKKTVL